MFKLKLNEYKMIFNLKLKSFMLKTINTGYCTRKLEILKKYDLKQEQLNGKQKNRIF